MSRLSLFLRRRKIDPAHHTRRALARYVDKRGFEIGDYTYGTPEIMPWGQAKLIIGNYCSIASGVKILLGGNHRADWVSTFPFKASIGFPEANQLSDDYETSRGDVNIGSDVWIGLDATILSGVTIGHGAVIGAGAVVGTDVAPYSVVVGNPGKTIKKRFSEQQVADLLDTAWWELQREQLVPLLPLLCGPDVEAFVAACREIRSS